jgi:energy-coupling factor transporter ATP-binding protein EcfA2
MSEFSICPYPGLRPFNQDESVFFKGREEHISKIISQLQDKKFIMVTGASGDGKSSLIYAGLIPRARAGFFKSRFNNWIIADMKPERSPLKNLAFALNKFLEINNLSHVEEELSYGFSSLVKVYKESEFYYDEESTIKNSETELASINAKCSNLLILIDQFEELFTNSENFNNGKPSVESATLINLIIETSRIAKEKNLPIYIVCTMRSDYIGDCATFKGLPEHIVYSQFFVPRLKRQEIHKAILEPALLCGDKINNRLIEKIINELTDGQDQLPILQHALNRIWRSHKEDKSEEMDLIHFAKVGGMKPEALPADQKTLFYEWLKNQSDFKRKILANPSLLNVLNAHAKELYNNSIENFSDATETNFNKEELKDTLKKIFTCLTKKNNNRIVRNRMSVIEIKQILNNEKVNNFTISNLLKPFRDTENTLVQPFINSLNPTIVLNDNGIIDITHESLIRNWNDLTEWTEKDHDNYLILGDFKKQLEKWEDNNRSKDYLLTIGSLNYFQNWISNFNFNQYQLVKFDESTLSPQEKLNKSSAFIQSSNEFLLKSDDVIKQKKRSTILITSVILLVLIGFTAWAFVERNKAIDQQDLAIKKTEEANKSKQEAINSRNLAENSKTEALKSKENALKNAELAVLAKQDAEKSAIAALSQKNIALEATAFAQIQAKKAQTEAERANSEAENAKKQTQIAEESKNSAISSEKKAKDLSLATLSQQLAYKSNEKFDDSQLSGLLAMHAFNYHHEIFGNKLDPVIYNGINNAFSELKSENYFSYKNKTEKEQKLIGYINESAFFTLGNNGAIYFWDINSRKIISEDLNTLAKNGTINFSQFDEVSKTVIVGYDNYTVSLFKVTDKKTVNHITDFTFLKGLLRAGNINNNIIQLVNKNGEIFSFDINQPKDVKNAKIEKTISSNCNYSGEFLLVGTTTGELLSVKGTEYEYLLKNIPGSITAIRYDKHSKKLFIGTSLGILYEYDYSGKLPVEQSSTKISKGSISKLEYNDNLKKCVALSSDKKIIVVDYLNKKSSPASITNSDIYVRGMMLTPKGKIITSCSDLKLREFDTNMAKMADELCAMLKRNLTKTEWNKYIGDNFEYKVLNCIK